MNKPWHIALFFVLCIAAGSAIGFGLAHIKRSDSGRPVSPLIIIPKKSEPVTITFIGDIMMDRGVQNSITRNFGGDYDKFLSFAKTIFTPTDIAFANLEGPVGTKGPNVGSSYSFQMNPSVIPALTSAGLDIVSFANNHVGDRSTTGFTETLANLRSGNLLFAGAGDTKSQAEQPTIINVRGKKIGFIGFTDVGPNWLAAKDVSPGVLLLSDPNLETIIKNAKSQVDFLVVSVHWGVEYNPATTRQKEYAHKLIDWGADTVIGHHPHIVQATEWYNGKFIAYSLGNFIFDQYFSDATLQGLVVTMTILDNNETTVDQKIVELSRQYQPVSLREPTDKDYLTKGTVAAQTCPAAKDAETDLWLAPVGPDKDIGSYIPKNLVTMTNRIDARGSATCLVSKAADAVESMFADMESAGLKPVMTSGFRSRATQETVHDGSEETANADPAAGKYPSVALPGHSEHQLGIALDMKSGTADELSYDNFYASAEYAWLVKHAADYGFVQSYQKGKEPVTGYRSEP